MIDRGGCVWNAMYRDGREAAAAVIATSCRRRINIKKEREREEKETMTGHRTGVT